MVKSRTRGLVVPARVWSQGDLRERECVFGDERETNDEMAALRVLLQTDEDLSLRMCVRVTCDSYEAQDSGRRTDWTS